MASGDIIRIGGGFDRNQYNAFPLKIFDDQLTTTWKTLFSFTGKGYLDYLRASSSGGKVEVRVTVDDNVIAYVRQAAEFNGNMEIRSFELNLAHSSGFSSGYRNFSPTLVTDNSGDTIHYSTHADILFKNSFKVEARTVGVGTNVTITMVGGGI